MTLVSTTLPADGQTVTAASVDVPFNAILTTINGNIDNTNIKAGSITGANIAASTISSSNIVASTITGDKIANGAVVNTAISMFGNMVTLSTPNTAIQTGTVSLQSVSVTVPVNCNKCLVAGTVRVQKQNGAGSATDLTAYAFCQNNTSTSYATVNDPPEGSSLAILDVLSVIPGSVTTAQVIAGASGGFQWNCSAMNVKFIFFYG